MSAPDQQDSSAARERREAGVGWRAKQPRPARPEANKQRQGAVLGVLGRCVGGCSPVPYEVN